MIKVQKKLFYLYFAFCGLRIILTILITPAWKIMYIYVLHCRKYQINRMYNNDLLFFLGM